MPQLKGRVNWTWWTVFAPQWLNHMIHIPLQLAVLYYGVSPRRCRPCFPPASIRQPSSRRAPAAAAASTGTPMPPPPPAAQHQMVETQIGPPPPIHATPGMHLQYHVLRRMRLKSHVIDALSSLIESLAMVRARPAAAVAAAPPAPALQLLSIAARGLAHALLAVPAPAP
jgi:hypothetical protein